MTTSWFVIRSTFWDVLMTTCPSNIHIGVGVTTSPYLIINEVVPFKVFKWVLWNYSRRLMHITQSGGDKKCFIVSHLENYHYSENHADLWRLLHTVVADQGLRLVSQWGSPLPHADTVST
jgi:hypothetical protein